MGNTPESGSKGRNTNSSSYATNVDFTGIGLPSNFGGQHYELPPNFQKLNQNTEKARHSIEEKESKPQPKKRQNTAPNFSLQKEMEIDYQITLTDIKGLLNDHSTIDRRFYKQNFGAGSSLLLRYQRDLKLIADRNRILHTKAALSSKTLNEVMRHSHATHDDWMRLSKQLQNVTQIVDSLNQTKTRLKLILKKVEISQAILIEDTKAMLEIPFQKLKNEQTKQLDTIRNSNRLHLIAIANELEVERKASLDQKSAEQAKRSQKEEEVQRKRLQQRQKQLASKFEVQKENFEIYGAVTPLAGDDCPDVVHSRSDAKLEDITFEYKPSALDQFFSPVLPNKNESAANDTADAAELEFEQIDEPAPLVEGVNVIEEPEESKKVVLLEDEDEFV